MTDFRTYLDDKGNFAKPGWSKAAGLPDSLEKKFTTFEGFAKSYVNLEAMLGKQGKVSVPTEHSSPEEKEAFYQKIGRPNRPEEYELKVDDKLKAAGVDDKELSEYKTVAHKLGLTREQLAGLAAFHFGRVGSGLEAAQKQAAQVKEAAVADLKKEWGTGYDEKVKEAERGAAIVGLTPDVLKATPELSNNPHFIRAMAKVAAMTKEDQGAGFRQGGGAMGVNTPDAAKAKIREIRADKAHPYNDLNASPRAREAARVEMEGLYAIAHPEPAQR